MKAALLTALACLAALALIPGKAAAATCAPSGNSAIAQYFETIPGGSCNMRPPGCHSSSAGPRNLSPSEVRRLTSEGAAGRAVIGFVSSYAPPIRGKHQSAAATGSGESPIAALGRLMLTGSSTRTSARASRSPCPNSSDSNTGAGLVLPILLAVALVGAIIAVLVRRRPAQPSLAQ